MIKIFEGEEFNKIREVKDAATRMIKGDMPKDIIHFYEGYIWCFNRMVSAIEKDYEREKLYKD